MIDVNENFKNTSAEQRASGEKQLVRVGITHGDTNGVGYELILKIFSDSEMFDLLTPIVYGSPKVATYYRKVLASQTNFQTVARAEEAAPGRLNLVSCFDDEIKVEMGQPSAEAGLAARLALEMAVRDLKEGKIDVLVTAPVNKKTLESDSFPYAGHTDYLDAALGNGDGSALMMLASGSLRVALATTHLPISKVAAAITPELLEKKLRTLHTALQQDFLLSMPRIAVLGLNPHNGDGGLLGDEEENVIRPVVRKLSEEGLNVFGPYAADGFFGSGDYSHFDAVFAMYHDQGLAPFKALAMDQGVNVTLGLPFLRTSPDHGTAYDIVGQGIASELSFRHALFMAVDLFRNRRIYQEAGTTPLPKLYHDRREDQRPRRFSPASELEGKDLEPREADRDAEIDN